MGVFTRFKDIVGANINAMLDRAEDPEKMIRLMVREMEETLVELKASCAGLMADKRKIQRELEQVQERMDIWNKRAVLAVEKNRDDLAREALLEKSRFGSRAQALRDEMDRFDALVEQAKDDIGTLEEKLASAKEKQRLLVQRHIRASNKKRAETDVRKAMGAEALRRFEEFEQRIERMEAEAELVNPASSSAKRSLDEEFALLEGHDEIEKELQALKQKGAAPEGKE